MLVSLLIVTAAMAAAPPPQSARPTKKPKALIIELPADATFSKPVTAAFNDFLAGAFRDQGFEVVSPTDIGAVLGLERQKQLLGCAESSCLADIGGALGVDYIVRPTLAVLDTDTALTIVLVNDHGRAINQVREVVNGKSSSVLLKALEAMVPKLVAPLRPQLSPSEGASSAPQQLEATQRAPSSGGGRTIGLAIAGVGAAGLATGAIFAGLANSNSSKLQTAVLGGSGDVQGLRSSVRNDERIEAAALGIGAVALTVGAILYFTSGEPADSAQALRLQPNGALAFDLPTP